MAELSLTDLSPTPKWRVFGGFEQVHPGTSQGSGDSLVWSVTPGEWTVLGSEPDEAVDLTHVRAMFRLTGDDATDLINRVCALDLSDGMFPNGAAARTLFAGVATEIVRDDENETPSYLLLPSRSFSTYVLDVILDAGSEFGLDA
ncbi:MAG: sarcosine oxidase subunit gamma [Actinomycetota bacterium]